MKEFVEFELIERLYFFELDRKQQLESNISLPTGAIVAAFGVLGYYFTHFHFGGEAYKFGNIVETIFLVSSAFSCGLLTLSTYWCFQAAVGSTYEYLAGSETLRKYFDGLKAWHQENSPKRLAMNNAKTEFEEYLIESMAKCSQKNWNTNLVRSEELHRTKRFTVLGLVALAICAFTYYLDFWYDPRSILG
jgi:hypothetical protein